MIVGIVAFVSTIAGWIVGDAFARRRMRSRARKNERTAYARWKLDLARTLPKPSRLSVNTWGAQPPEMMDFYRSAPETIENLARAVLELDGEKMQDEFVETVVPAIAERADEIRRKKEADIGIWRDKFVGGTA